jgi:hypothetical protein
MIDLSYVFSDGGTLKQRIVVAAVVVVLGIVIGVACLWNANCMRATGTGVPAGWQCSHYGLGRACACEARPVTDFAPE